MKMFLHLVLSANPCRCRLGRFERKYHETHKWIPSHHSSPWDTQGLCASVQHDRSRCIALQLFEHRVGCDPSSRYDVGLPSGRCQVLGATPDPGGGLALGATNLSRVAETCSLLLRPPASDILLVSRGNTILTVVCLPDRQLLAPRPSVSGPRPAVMAFSTPAPVSGPFFGRLALAPR